MCIFAHRSREWVCPDCKQRNIDLLPEPTPAEEEKEEKEPEEPKGEKAQEEESRRGEPEEPSTASIPEEEEPRAESDVVEAAEVAVRVKDDDKVRRPPVLLDGAICVVCVLLFALLCRRFI